MQLIMLTVIIIKTIKPFFKTDRTIEVNYVTGLWSVQFKKIGRSNQSLKYLQLYNHVGFEYGPWVGYF